MVQGHWWQAEGSLLKTGWTWEQVWNQLQTLQDMGMRMQLTTSEQHTIQRLFELELYYQKEQHPSALRGVSGDTFITTLTLIPGIGEDKAKAIKDEFGCLGALAGLSFRPTDFTFRMQKVKGVGQALEQRIRNFFWEQQDEELRDYTGRV